MPTGYTADVADGTVTTLHDFAMGLARGMGALVTMRDLPRNSPVPEAFQPSDYHAKRLADAVERRDRLYAMTDEEAQSAADAEYAEDQEAQAKARADHDSRRARYEAMIAQVYAWKGAPEGIKAFGLEQLQSGMEFDCGEPFRWYHDIQKVSGEEWKQSELEAVVKDIAYHTKEHAAECARVEGRNAWLAQLRKSLS